MGVTRDPLIVLSRYHRKTNLLSSASIAGRVLSIAIQRALAMTFFFLAPTVQYIRHNLSKAAMICAMVRPLVSGT